MSNPFLFQQVARLPAPGDNVAIACRVLEAGTIVSLNGGTFELPYTVIEGHRFAAERIEKGRQLLSWGLPFGTALRDIQAGEYICNAKILDSLASRHVRFSLPAAANFEDHYVVYRFDPARFKPGVQVPLYDKPGSFTGFTRAGGRGVGTRNYIVVMGTSSLTSSFARLLAERFRDVPSRFANVDGVVAVAHTEGGGPGVAFNHELVLRTLSGFAVHPNVAALLAVDFGDEPVNNPALREYLRVSGYPMAQVPHEFLSIKNGFEAALDAGANLVQGWLPIANDSIRTKQPLEHLKIGLQCGGSDAFSGVSGNPLVGWMGRELIRHGGSANLAETDELIGAEEYVLSNVKDEATARAFLAKVARFSELAARHGHSAEGNPSGGNNFRGLYNIAIKSIGAALKKDPAVRIDEVIDYAHPMKRPGFYFMDSPGNDLESIAGQVGSGCNMILFTTGNGSITNFPFVPTIKFVTTTGRYNLVRNEMDFNAGRYQDGESMDALGAEAFGLMLRVASGERSVGERAGHAQTQLWREWRQPPPGESTRAAKLQPGDTIFRKKASVNSLAAAPLRFRFGGDAARVGLLLPTSLCAGQVGRMIATRLNALPEGDRAGMKFTALPHTEGCGCSSGDSEEILLRILLGHLSHPIVRGALVLEHGCEKTHNDALKNTMTARGMDPAHFGWASIQLDGGIESVTSKIQKWASALAGAESVKSGIRPISLGLMATTVPSDLIAHSMAVTAAGVLAGGGSVLVPANSLLWHVPSFVDAIPDSIGSLQFATVAGAPGLFRVECPTDHTVETITGLAASGVDAVLCAAGAIPVQGHPLIPVLTISSSLSIDCDMELKDGMSPEFAAAGVVELLLSTLENRYVPRNWQTGNTEFQVTRGLWGVSL